MASVHYAFDQFEISATNRQIGWPRSGHSPCSVANLRSESCQRIHAGHNCWVVRGRTISNTRRAASGEYDRNPGQLIERLHGLASAGLNQVMVLPNITRTQVLDRIGKDIIPHVRDF